MNQNTTEPDHKKMKEDPAFYDDDDDDDYASEQEEEGMLRWKEDLKEKAKTAFFNRQQGRQNLSRLVYGDSTMEEQKEEDDVEDDKAIGGLFAVAGAADADNNHRSKYPREKPQELFPPCTADGDYNEVSENGLRKSSIGLSIDLSLLE